MRLSTFWGRLASVQDWWRLLAAEEVVGEAQTSLAASLFDFRLALHGYEPLVTEEELEILLEDHISRPREVDALWHRPPRRASTGEACSTLPEKPTCLSSGLCLPPRPRCEPPDKVVCLDLLLPTLLRETDNGMRFVKELLDTLDEAMLRAQGGAASLVPPLGGHALGAAQALDKVLGLFLGFLERVDFSPRLGACLGTELGRRLRDAVMRALEQQRAIGVEVQDLRWELASNGRLAHARYGLQKWHVDSVRHIVLQAGWTLFHLSKLGSSTVDESDAETLLGEMGTELESEPNDYWPLELRSALHSGSQRQYVDKGLLRFLLAHVVVSGDTICDFGAFAGRYSEWLNDTGLVSARAFDGIPGVEALTDGRVRHARLESPGLDVGPCDVTLCLEVLEHVARHDEEVALRNLEFHTRRYLVASWAPPWVGGVGHVNQKTPAEAQEAIERCTGFALDAALTARARASAEVEWVAQSVAVYLRPLATG